MERILIIDCEDSFTNNILDYLNQCGASTEILHYNEINIDSLENYHGLVLSPGPKTPMEIPILFEVIKKCHEKIPILGICLGHQAIGIYFKHELVRSIRPMHGLTSKLSFIQDRIFEGIGLFDLQVMRYNSLCIIDKINSNLQVICRDDNHEIMGFKHSDYPIYSFQFHPESIGTTHGMLLIENWLKAVKEKVNPKIDKKEYQ